MKRLEKDEKKLVIGLSIYIIICLIILAYLLGTKNNKCKNEIIIPKIITIPT